MPTGVYKRTAYHREVNKKGHIGQKAWNTGKKVGPLSKEHRRKISKALVGIKKTEKHKLKVIYANTGQKRPSISGDKNPSWKGGITPVNKAIRSSTEYKLWRKAVFERDGYVCIWGGKAHGNKLQADHIKPFALYPELRFAIDNGRTLCVKCHSITPTWKGRTRAKK